MPVGRSEQTKQIPINVAGSSTFGRYPKISIEKTINMFVSQDWLVPYAGYEVIIPSSELGNGNNGRGIFTSTKFNGLVAVFNNNVYLIEIYYNQITDKAFTERIIKIGQLETTEGVVYITENNKPQLLISDNENLYIYDTTVASTIQQVKNLNFTPGYVTFHDTYFICSASNDQTYSPAANNTWRLSLSNEGFVGPASSTAWPATAPYVGLLETKPDNTQAVVRFPSKGNMIFVMGQNVTEAWFDTGSQLFPYQRTNQFNIDYGCVSPATVAYMDEIVVWLAQNEKSGPIIMYSDGGMPKKITTDGIDFLFSELQFPADSQGFLYRQDGHLFYHINFYSDNLSLFYDFNTEKFYHASDQNLNYFIAAEIAFIGNQYYFVSKNTGNLYAFDTSFTTYQDNYSPNVTTLTTFQIPRIRICKNVRLPSQDYFIANDIGFTIESGETNYHEQDENQNPIPFGLLDGTNFLLLNGQNFNLLSEESDLMFQVPNVELAISIDGGANFGNYWAYYLPSIGLRKNRLIWWQLGMANDFVPLFRFNSFGRVVATDGILNVRL